MMILLAASGMPERPGEPEGGTDARGKVKDEILDLEGLKCPLPALRTGRALRDLPSGSVLVVRCTDPLSAIDIPNLVRETGDALDAQEKTGSVLTFRIRKR